MTKSTQTKGQKSVLWKHPWGYKESFLIGLFILLAGFLMELLMKGGVNMPAWPVNLAIIVIFIIYFILVHYLVKHPVVRWLSSTPAAIASMSAFTLMVLFLGFIRQGPSQNPGILDNLGLTNVTSSWPYLLSALYLLIVLGFTIVRRFKVFTLRNIAFLVYHIGLWIVIVAGSMGSADMWRLSMQLEKKHPVMTAYDSQGQAYNMGFGMLLLDFTIEEYPPQIGLMRNDDYTLQLEKGGKLATVKEGEICQLEDYTVHIERYLTNARKYDREYDTTSAAGGARAVYISVSDANGNKLAEGWVSNGSYSVPPSHLVIDEGLSVAMLQSMPKEYSSDIRIYHSMEDYEDFYIEVNKPVTVDGWKIYQVGYDETMGRWSERSVIELVRDPWLPVVYTGIFMILVGVLYLLWMGKGRTKTKRT